MIFTLAILAATLAVAGLPNALGVVTGDIDKYRGEVDKNISLTGDPTQLKKDLADLRNGLRWSIIPLLAQLFILLILVIFAIGTLRTYWTVDFLLRRWNWWLSIHELVLKFVQPLIDADKNIFDRVLAGACAIVALVLFYWRGWRPYVKGKRAVEQGTAALNKLRESN